MPAAVSVVGKRNSLGSWYSRYVSTAGLSSCIAVTHTRSSPVAAMWPISTQAKPVAPGIERRPQHDDVRLHGREFLQERRPRLFGPFVKVVVAEVDGGSHLRFALEQTLQAARRPREGVERSGCDIGLFLPADSGEELVDDMCHALHGPPPSPRSPSE